MNSLSNIDKNEIRDRLKSISISKSELQQIENDSLILQANYLSEIERLYKDGGLNRKELAQKIKTSPSYLTQVFRGDKPLNFITLAKIKRALGLQFEVQASFKSEKKTENIIDGGNFFKVNTEHLKTGSSTASGGHMVTNYDAHVFIALNVIENKAFLEEA